MYVSGALLLGLWMYDVDCMGSWRPHVDLSQVWNGHNGLARVRVLYVIVAASCVPRIPNDRHSSSLPLNAPLFLSARSTSDTTRRVSTFTIHHRIQASSSFIIILASSYSTSITPKLLAVTTPPSSLPHLYHTIKSAQNARSANATSLDLEKVDGRYVVWFRIVLHMHFFAIASCADCLILS
jgi:hypothetical protein